MASGAKTQPRGFTRLLVRWLVHRYYPKIEVTGGDRIPQTGPILLCANHPNSLLDPVLLGIAARRPVRFLAKAPLFDHPILGPPMRALGMIPAFRGSDDAREVRRNIESLQAGADVLVGGQALGIFPEGKSTDQAHLEMVRSGAARMAVQAVERGATGLLVIPIGICYQRKDQFRSSAWIQIGEPIDVGEWVARHECDGRKAVRSLTKELESRLKAVVVHLDEPEWEPWLDDLEILVPPAKGPAHLPTPPLHRRKRIADAINHFLAHDRPRADSVAHQIEAYRDQVHAAGLSLASPVLRWRGPRVYLKLLVDLLCLAILLAPALAGTLHHLVPFVVVRRIASWMDQPGRQTISTHRMLVGVPLYLLWYAVVAWWMFAYLPAWLALAWLIAAPFCGLVALYYWHQARRTVLLLWHQLRVQFGRQKLQHLRRQESEIHAQLAQLAEEYVQASLSYRPDMTSVEMSPTANAHSGLIETRRPP